MALFETVRVFAALNVEVAAIRRVAETAERLRLLPSAMPARWVSPTKMHVTLKFFGDLDAGIVPALRDGLNALVRETPAPRLAIGGLAAFPSAVDARVIFAEVDDLNDETAHLAAAIDDLADSFGLARETRPYHPHLTLARTNSALAVGPWISSLPPWRVVTLAPELVLYRSELSHPGAEYDALGRFALAARKSSKKTS
jgi:2'-5' RNA ligase